MNNNFIDNYWTMPRIIEVLAPDEENHIRIVTSIIGKDDEKIRDGRIYISKQCIPQLINILEEMRKEQENLEKEEI